MKEGTATQHGSCLSRKYLTSLCLLANGYSQPIGDETYSTSRISYRSSAGPRALGLRRSRQLCHRPQPCSTLLVGCTRSTGVACFGPVSFTAGRLNYLFGNKEIHVSEIPPLRYAKCSLRIAHYGHGAVPWEAERALSTVARAIVLRGGLKLPSRKQSLERHENLPTPLPWHGTPENRSFPLVQRNVYDM